MCDAVVFLDVFHMLDNKEQVLRELHRVLKPEGVMWFSDHHMGAEVIEEQVTGEGLFAYVGHKSRVDRFVKK